MKNGTFFRNNVFFIDLQVTMVVFSFVCDQVQKLQDWREADKNSLEFSYFIVLAVGSLILSDDCCGQYEKFDRLFESIGINSQVNFQSLAFNSDADSLQTHPNPLQTLCNAEGLDFSQVSTT